MSQRTELDKLLLGLRLPGIRRKLKEETMTGEMHTLLYELFMVEVEERERRSEHRRIKNRPISLSKDTGRLNGRLSPTGWPKTHPRAFYPLFY